MMKRAGKFSDVDLMSKAIKQLRVDRQINLSNEKKTHAVKLNEV